MKYEEADENLDNFMEVDVSGIFIKHNFDHILLDEDEVEKYTNGNLTFAKMKQTLFIPFEYDVQVLLYFMHSHFPNVQTELGQDEVDATLAEKSLEKKDSGKHDLKIMIGSNALNQKEFCVELKYYYRAQKVKVEWTTSPKTDMIADSVCLLIL